MNVSFNYCLCYNDTSGAFEFVKMHYLSPAESGASRESERGHLEESLRTRHQAVAESAAIRQLRTRPPGS